MLAAKSHTDGTQSFKMRAINKSIKHLEEEVTQDEIELRNVSQLVGHHKRVINVRMVGFAAILVVGLCTALSVIMSCELHSEVDSLVSSNGHTVATAKAVMTKDLGLDALLSTKIVVTEEGSYYDSGESSGGGEGGGSAKSRRLWGLFGL